MIRAKTGDGSKYAGTDAKVEIRLYGSDANCGWKVLDNKGNDFEKGR